MRSHRTLKAWIDGRDLSRLALRASRECWKPYASGLFSQLQRAALSIQLNIAEGHAIGGRARFVNHLRIAYGSAVETEELLQLAMEEGLLPTGVAEDGLEKCQRCQKLLAGVIKRYRATT